MINFILLSLTLLTFTCYAQQGSEHAKYWSPTVTAYSQKFDWLKLNSGEWFKGDIVSMYDDELEFDSDKFSIITFDWEDVAELHSRFDQRIRFANGEVKQGFLVVKDQHLIVISNGTEEHYPLSELLSITSSADDRKELWDGKISLGIDVNAGNVNTLDYLATAKIQRRTPFTRFNIDFSYNYSKSTVDEDDKVITDTSRLTAYLDWFYSPNIFFRMLDYAYSSDLEQNIDARHTLGVSAGYHLVNNKRLQWDITIGPSFQTTSYYNVDEDANQKSGVIAFSTAFEYNFSSRIDYIFDYQIQFVEEGSGKRNSYLKTGFEFDVHHGLELDITFSLDRVAEPVATINTQPPESNDYSLVASLAYDF